MTTPANLALEVIGLNAGYGVVSILHDVSLKVTEGTVTTLVGANGAGKTTLMRVVSGLLEAASGSVRLHGQDITHAPTHARVNSGLVLIPEGRLIFPKMTVEQNLLLGAITRRARASHSVTETDVFSRFPRLKERRMQLAGTMSGGEQQMLALGRGLMGKPRLVLMDEPTLGLAPIMVKQVFQTIEELRRDGFTILLAEQNARQALELADDAYVIENGRIKLSGPGPELARSEHVRRIYLGF
jgi:branched-chain amino acid transport system ATP-binding protein